uniref:F-box associated domain-containing protein n=1 Tax=Setaria viridis TaxID=4556 RepID=A0A4U6T912_SETVI|nr:hypothetical protein SEVIR_9G452000v2 [Setaria viridis]
MEAETALPVPDDALAEILGRLPLRLQGVARPRRRRPRLRGIFINYTDYGEPLLLARPSPGGFPRISGDLSYVPGFGHSYTHFINHCNGLLLCYGEFGYDDYYVVNPATRRWESFSSPRVNVNGRGDHAAYLVFDPAVSPHCEVFWIPYLSRPEEAVRPENVPAATFSLSGLFSLAMEGTDEEEEVLEELARPVPPPSMEQGLFPTRKLSLLARSRLGKPYDPYGLMEWPQSPCTLHVFSSRTRRWEERPFVREGEPVGMAKDARWDHFCVQYGVYWQGTLYVHCPGGFVMRFSLKLGKYRVIKTPEDIGERHARRYLGRSIGLSAAVAGRCARGHEINGGGLEPGATEAAVVDRMLCQTNPRTTTSMPAPPRQQGSCLGEDAGARDEEEQGVRGAPEGFSSGEAVESGRRQACGYSPPAPAAANDSGRSAAPRTCETANRTLPVLAGEAGESPSEWNSGDVSLGFAGRGRLGHVL